MTSIDYTTLLNKEEINKLVRYCLQENIINITDSSVVIVKDKKEKIPLEWLQDWNKLFPTGKDTAHRENLRDTIPGKYGVKTKMEKFLKEFDYSLETIKSATQAYLKNQQSTGYRHTKRSGYFISKSPEPSRLASECEKYLTEGDLSSVQDKLVFGDDLNS